MYIFIGSIAGEFHIVLIVVRRSTNVDSSRLQQTRTADRLTPTKHILLIGGYSSPEGYYVSMGAATNVMWYVTDYLCRAIGYFGMKWRRNIP